MKLYILYRDRSEHARSVVEFIEILRRRYPDRKPTLVELDTREGASMASMYEITRYPAILVTSYGGNVLGQWEGEPLPLVDEVISRVLQAQATTSV